MRKFKTLRRKIDVKEPRSRFYIFSEGALTEFEYFEALRRLIRNSNIEIINVGGVGSPKTISDKCSDKAKEIRKKGKEDGSYSKKDQVWAVFDRDEHPNISDAFTKCRDNDVSVAFSNPCFELWITLHLQDFSRAEHRHKMQKFLEGICPSYCATNRKTADFSKILLGLEAAERRAAALFKEREKDGGDPLGAPVTTVYLLTAAIKAAAVNSI